MKYNGSKIITNEQAVKHLISTYTGIYLDIAFSQFMLSRQTKNIEESLKDVYDKIIEITTRIIERSNF